MQFSEIEGTVLQTIILKISQLSIANVKIIKLHLELHNRREKSKTGWSIRNRRVTKPRKGIRGDRQFLLLRKLEIQFEKSNNAGQFAGKCASHPNALGIVRRLDTMRPIGGPGFLQHSRLFLRFPDPLFHPGAPHHVPPCYVAVQRPARQTTSFISFSAYLSFFYATTRRYATRRQFASLRAKTERNRRVPRFA